jgi:hypothetical protein
LFLIVCLSSFLFFIYLLLDCIFMVQIKTVLTKLIIFAVKYGLPEGRRWPPSQGSETSHGNSLLHHGTYTPICEGCLTLYLNLHSDMHFRAWCWCWQELDLDFTNVNASQLFVFFWFISMFLLVHYNIRVTVLNSTKTWVFAQIFTSAFHSVITLWLS